MLRGWGPATALTLAAVSVASVPAGVDPSITMAAASGVAGAAAVVAVATAATASVRRPRPWRRAVPAGAAGATTGLLMVAVSASAAGAATWLVGLALVPSLLASLVGGARLATYWQVVPEALSTIPIGERAVASRRVAQRLLLGGVLLVLGVLVVLSAAVEAIADAVERSPATVPLLAGFGALALVALVVTMLEAFARPWWATGTGLAASGAHAAVGELTSLPATTIVALAVGSALLVALPPMLALLRRPDLTMATLV